MAFLAAQGVAIESPTWNGDSPIPGSADCISMLNTVRSYLDTVSGYAHTKMEYESAFLGSRIICWGAALSGAFPFSLSGVSDALDLCEAETLFAYTVAQITGKYNDQTQIT